MKNLNLDTDKLHDVYVSNAPFPHIVIDNVFEPGILDDVLSEFPALGTAKDASFNNPYELKMGTKGESRFGEKTKSFFHYLNSEPFLLFLTKLTGIENLIPDPYFSGGGLHEIKRGGFLKIHADFNKHNLTRLDRRLNVLIYLNKDWEESYGGHFELWDKTMTHSDLKILPVFNRMVVFSTTDTSYHGHPEPLHCPEHLSRKSMALYYYTNGRPESEINADQVEHGTLFQKRPDEIIQEMKPATTLKDVIKLFIPPVFLKIKRKLF